MSADPDCPDQPDQPGPPDRERSGPSDRERLSAARAATEHPTAAAAAKLADQAKLYVRDRIAVLADPGSFVEDGQLANALAGDLPADGVVTGACLVDGRPVLVVANDPGVKAGSWGARTVEKILRITERALGEELPVFWLIDSAGARITDQVALFPGRRGAGRIFHHQVMLSGKVPQICCLFGPSAAGGAYIPAFCDIVVMVEANAGMYLGSPRMAEVSVGETVSLEEMGGARMHTSVSGCGDLLADDDVDALELARAFFSYLPSCWREPAPETAARPPAHPLDDTTVPAAEQVPFDIHPVIDGILDEESFFELKPDFAAEIVTGLGRIEGMPVGLVASNSAVRGGVLFVDSADKAARFVELCDAFNVPLVHLADVPGFMIGQEVERQGIIRHGAKMITAISEAGVPQISVIVRKAYGAGLYAMNGPGFEPDACLALPTARIAVMGPDPAVRAVFAHRIAAITDPARREEFVAARRAEYEADVDLLRLASDLVVDAVVEPAALRSELARRLAMLAGKLRRPVAKHHGVRPV